MASPATSTIHGKASPGKIPDRLIFMKFVSQLFLTALTISCVCCNSLAGLPGSAVRADDRSLSKPVTINDKTLVVWAAPANLTQHGGSVLTLDDQMGQFDGIIFGEIAPARWMAGSDFYRRTHREQDAWPAETSGPNTLVQVALVYRGHEIVAYRNGQEYSRHTIDAPQSFGPDKAVLIGPRHLADMRDCFAGKVDDARIYDFALSAEQIAALKPNEASEPKPVAWWNFENGRAQDVMGAFPEARILGNARIEAGKLVLDGQGSGLLTPATVVPKPAAPSGPPAHAPMPVYHFTSPTGKDCGPFDPNGAIFFKGRYHLGYIYQEGGKHFWGHASTADLIHWQMHPPMLSPGPETGIFSGNAFFDKQGRVVLSYHGLGLGGNCLAIAQDDDLNVFKKLDANPVMKNPGWDPHTWVEDGTYYSISGGNPGSGNPASLYTSADSTLTKWDLLGPLLSKEMPEVFSNEDISCPDLFKLGNKHILLCISHIRGARYYVGRFENKQFLPESHHRMNWPGGTCFAPETLLDAKGRRLMWAWVLGSPSTMTLPRVLSLGDNGALNIEPAEELNTLRRNPQSLANIDVPADTSVAASGIKGDTKELLITLDPQQSTQCGVKVRCSPDGAEETVLSYDPARRVLRIEMDKSSLNQSVRPRTYAMTFMLPRGAENPAVSAQEAPFELKAGELLNLRLYLDHSILEVFANGRQCVTQRLWPTRADSVGIAFFSRGGSAKVRSLEAWDMSPTSLAPLAKSPK